jgi:hypothetical protein
MVVFACLDNAETLRLLWFKRQDKSKKNYYNGFGSFFKVVST